MQRLALASIVLSAASVASAAPVVDGSFSAAEYAGVPSVTRDSFINGADAAAGYQRTTRYLSYDAANFYLAIVADTSFTTTAAGTPTNAFAAKPGPFVNAYLYSSTGQNRLAGGAGTYGDGDDLIVETSAAGANVSYALDGTTTGVWGQSIGTLAPQGTNGDATLLGNAALGITAAIDSVNGVYELSVPKSLVDADLYDSIRAGGQAWAYGNTFNNFAVAAVPEPAALVAVAGGAILLLGVRRRRA